MAEWSKAQTRGCAIYVAVIFIVMFFTLYMCDVFRGPQRALQLMFAPLVGSLTRAHSPSWSLVCGLRLQLRVLESDDGQALVKGLVTRLGVFVYQQ